MITLAKTAHVRSLEPNPVAEIRQQIADAHRELTAPHFLFEITKRTLCKRINRLQEELRDLNVRPKEVLL